MNGRSPKPASVAIWIISSKVCGAVSPTRAVFWISATASCA
jgi:hypothetical protein